MHPLWHAGRPAAEQCEGCTFNTSHITELAYLHSRDVSYAVFGQGPYEEASRYRDFMGYPVPWYSVPPDAVDRLVADRYFGILACYLRDGDQVFETYWTTGRGNELMAPPSDYPEVDLSEPAGPPGGRPGGLRPGAVAGEGEPGLGVSPGARRADPASAIM